MSSDVHTQHHGDDHGHGHDGVPHGTMKGYMTGFILSVILTAIPFWLVMAEVFQNHAITAAIILVFAAVQMVVHVIYFLHMNVRVEAGWSIMALIFTIVIVVIALSGSIWVMYHLNTNMMPPMSPDMMRNMP